MYNKFNLLLISSITILMMFSSCTAKKDLNAPRYLDALKQLMENDRRFRQVYSNNDTLVAQIDERMGRVEQTLDSLEVYVQTERRRTYKDYEASVQSAIEIITSKPNESIPKLLEELEESKKLDEQLIIKATEVENKATAELSVGKLDTVSYEKVTNVVEEIKVETTKEIEEKEEAIQGLKTAYSVPEQGEIETQIIESAYQTITRIRNQGSVAQQRNLEQLKLVVDVLETDKFKQFEAAAFFGPGAFTIKSADMPKVEAAFEPLINSIVDFVNRYRERDMTLTIVAKGYADATPISSSSPLYRELQPVTGKSNPSRQDLNRALSRLRADEMSRHMRELLLRRDQELFSNTSNISIDIISQGRGEECPYVNKSCDKNNDPNRRIVTFHWLVTPNKL